MPQRRILSLWFPRLAAERVLRAEPQHAGQPLGVVAERASGLILASLTAEAEAAGLRRGMSLGDGRAICPGLITRPEDASGDAAFLEALRRWAERFSPWVAEQGSEALMLDITGCAHLFGGEAALARSAESDAADFGLTLHYGLADTVGAAWAVARFAGVGAGLQHAGDAIDNEARATRSRARKRRWEKGGAAPEPPAGDLPDRARIVPAGGAEAHLAGLPVAALRLAPEQIAALNGLGLRRIGDITALPRAQLARRLGPEVMLRLDQALGRVAEPVAPARPRRVFALRMGFPDPIGLEADILAALDRLLDPLCARLVRSGQGVRRLRITLFRADGGLESREVAFARPATAPETIRPLAALRLAGFDAGFGIDALRVEAVALERVGEGAHRGQLAVSSEKNARQAADETLQLADLIGRIGARLGLEALTRLHPAESHIPERSATVMMAGFAAPAEFWPVPPVPRPVVLFPPEPVRPHDGESPLRAFVWRRKIHACTSAIGPERIAPEWWLDDPAWRSGPRDYWRVETDEGLRLWLYEARGDAFGSGWFAQGMFA
jgi:protein ImuB